MTQRFKEFLKISYIIFINSKNKKALLGSEISLSLTMIPLILVYYMSSYVMESTIQKYIKTEGFVVQLEYNSSENKEYLIKKLKKFAENNKHIDYFFERRTYAFIGQSKKQGILLRGVENKFLKENSELKVINGKRELSKDEILVSSYIKNKLNINLNEDIYIVVPNKKYKNIVPRIKKFKLVGIVETGLNEIDKNLTLISLSDSNIMGEEFSKNIIGINTKDLSEKNSTKLKNELEKSLNNYNIKTFYEIYINKYTNLDVSKKLLIFIMSFIVIFASINISSSLSMLILENKKKIAVFKSVGMKDLDIKIIFILMASVLSIIFCTIGIILGNYLTLNILSLIKIVDVFLNLLFSIFSYEKIEVFSKDYHINELYITLNLTFNAVILLVCTLISIIASLIPLNIISKFKEKELLK